MNGKDINISRMVEEIVVKTVKETLESMGSMMRYFEDIGKLGGKMGERIGVSDTDLTIGFPFTVDISFSIPSPKKTS